MTLFAIDIYGLTLSIITNQPIAKAHHKCQPKKTKTIILNFVYIKVMVYQGNNFVGANI